MQLSLEIALLCESFPTAADVWEAVASTHPEFDKLEVVDGFEDEKLVYSSVGTYLRKTGADGFLIELSDASIQHGNIVDLELSRLDLLRIVRDSADAERWLAKLLVSDQVDLRFRGGLSPAVRAPSDRRVGMALHSRRAVQQFMSLMNSGRL